MKKIAFISLLSHISIFATEKLDTEASMPWMLPWLISMLILLAVLYWGMYKAMKTKNPKYGYVIFITILVIAGLSFI